MPKSAMPVLFSSPRVGWKMEQNNHSESMMLAGFAINTIVLRINFKNKHSGTHTHRNIREFKSGRKQFYVSWHTHTEYFGNASRTLRWPSNTHSKSYCVIRRHSHTHTHHLIVKPLQFLVPSFLFYVVFFAFQLHCCFFSPCYYDISSLAHTREMISKLRYQGTNAEPRIAFP